MRDVTSLIAATAPTGVTVLITGESGTGKELVARMLHAGSPRRARPFVDVDCGALTPSLLESELFGHTRGAFTGAESARRGLFEEASGGTLFLDEVGELPPAAQTRLLRVLQERNLRLVGSSESRPIDVRVVAATNRDLEQMVSAGTFRKDLFYRLAVMRIDVPPLRERTEDLPELLEQLVARHAVRLHRAVPRLDPTVLPALARHSWPGNVRELENMIERALVLSRSGVLSAAAFPLPREPAALVAPRAAHFTTFGEARRAFEREYVATLLARVGNNLTEAARLAGVDRSNFRRLLRRMGLPPHA